MKQKFHQHEIKVPLAETKSSTSMKQKFHRHETAGPSARFHCLFPGKLPEYQVPLSSPGLTGQ